MLKNTLSARSYSRLANLEQVRVSGLFVMRPRVIRIGTFRIKGQSLGGSAHRAAADGYDGQGQLYVNKSFLRSLRRFLALRTSASSRLTAGPIAAAISKRLNK